jgi:NAD(P)-dependent dehydrogenase (short-subunit alcohol dehydrogenase family)
VTDIAIVVGAGGEIGAACAVSLAAGHELVLCVDRNEEAARATADHIRTLGGTAKIVVVDASSSDFAGSVVSAARALGTVRSVVHAIAHEEHASAREIGIDSVQRSLLLGPVAAFALFRGLYTSRALAAGAALTVIGSLHATHAFANALGYNLAQAALAQLVRTLAHEWAAGGVRVNAVVPGWIRTRGESAMYGDAHLDAAGAQLPMGRFGTSEDIASAVAYLSSAEASYVSGSFLTVDGALGASLATLPGEEV